MSMTVVNARIYVARIIGGGADSQETIDMADEAIRRAYQDWQNKKFWRFLLKDTSRATAITGCNATAGSAVVSAPSTGSFDFVNVGQTVTTTGSATLAADTTVSTVTRNTDGTVASITLSAVFGGTNNTNATLTFSANIPILTGVNEYNVPNDFGGPFTAQMTINKRNLTWRDQRWFDRIIYDQTANGFVECYTVYNPDSELTQNYGTKRLKFEQAPSEADTLLLRYYRTFNPNGTYVDMIDDFLYQFLDYARDILLKTKVAQDNPQVFGDSVAAATEGAVENDEQVTDDDDADQCMKSQWEMGNFNRQIWHNGAFNDTP